MRLTFGTVPTRRDGQSLRARRSRQWARLDKAYGLKVRVVNLSGMLNDECILPPDLSIIGHYISEHATQGA